MKRFVYWFIVIIGTGFILLTSYNIGEKLAVWHNSKNMPKRKITVTMEKTKNLINDYKDIFQYIKFDGLNDQLKLYVVFNKLQETEKPDSKYTCEDAFDKINDIVETNFVCENLNQDGNISSYSYDIVNKYYNELYGENLNKIDYNGSKYFNEYFKYSNKLDVYIELLNKYGVITNKEVYNYYDVLNKTYDNGKLDVEIAYLTYEKNNNIFEYEINGEKKTFENESELEDIFKNNKDLLSKLTFKYEKVDKNYILKEIK